MSAPDEVEALNAEVERLAELLDQFAALYPNAGPHSLTNDPWANALEFMTTLCAVVGVRCRDDRKATP